MSSRLPHDIIIDILIQLPPKSLPRFKGVCKSWRSLIEDRQFIKPHHDRCKSDINCQKYFMAGFDGRTNQYYYYCLDAPLQQDSHVSIIEHLPETPKPVVRARFVKSCNGLLLLVSDNDTIVMWNPTTRESRSIPSPFLVERGWKYIGYGFYGFGYVPSIDDYKIVIVGMNPHSAAFNVEIFSTKSNSWKLISKSFPTICFANKDIVIVEGIVYMIAFTKGRQDTNIVLFCLEKEQFEEVLFPNRLQRIEDPVLCSPGEKLCLTRTLHDGSTLDIEVWCMTENGISSSWSKILTIPWSVVDHTLPRPSYVGLVAGNESPVSFNWLKLLSFMKDGDLLLRRYGEFVVYNSKIHKFEQVKVAALTTCNWIVPYVETLLFPN